MVYYNGMYVETQLLGLIAKTFVFQALMLEIGCLATTRILIEPLSGNQSPRHDRIYNQHPILRPIYVVVYTRGRKNQVRRCSSGAE